MYNCTLKWWLESTYSAVSKREGLFVTLLLNVCFLSVQSSLSDNFSNKLVRDMMFGLGVVLRETLSRLFSAFNLSILDLYLETWLWSPLICAEKALHGRSGYMVLCENMNF